ncbi:MAG: DUF1515 family protein [Gemmatimonadaceae bacterium]|nr:DUF1515 family protein [Gemmatimonadaceae bacterium]
MNEPTRAEWDRLYAVIDRGFEGVHERLDALNGRTVAHAEQIAVLKDRSDDAQKAKWVDRGLGGIVAAALAALGYYK